jgi:hypothetical protein
MCNLIAIDGSGEITIKSAGSGPAYADVVTMTQTGFSTDNEWHFLAVVFNYDESVVNFYEDGEFIASQANTFKTNNKGMVMKQFGRNPSAGGSVYFDGHIDDIRVYRQLMADANASRGLTHQEVRWLYNGGTGRSGITLPRALDWSHFRDDGYDVRFISSDGNELDYTREVFAPTTPSTNTGSLTGVTVAKNAVYDIITDTNATFITNGVKSGMIIYHIDGSENYMSQIVSVDSETQLTVTHPYYATGFDTTTDWCWLSGDGYTIIPQAIFWVKVPTVATASNTYFYMYYGNPNASDGEDEAGTWSNDYNAVHLISPNGASRGYDSTGNGYTATINGVGTQLNGSAGIWTFRASPYNISYLATGALGFVDDASQNWSITLSLRSREEATQYILGAGATMQFSIYINGTIAGTIRDDELTNNISIGSINAGGYPPTHIGFGYTYGIANGTGVAYNGLVNTDTTLNTSSDLTMTASGSWTPSGSYDFIGCDAAGSNLLNGEVGQIFIATVRRSANWFKAEYSNMWSKIFVKYYGEEMGAPIISSVTTDGPKYGSQTIEYTINWYYEDAKTADFYLCKTDAYSSGCTGGSWASAITGETSSPSTMSFTVPATPGTYNAYVYGVDDSISASYSRNFVVSPLHIDSATDAPDPLYSGQDVTFTVNWTWPARTVDVFVCRTAAFVGGACVEGEYGHESDVTNTAEITYTTVGPDIGTNSYYVYIQDHDDTAIVGDNNG